MDLTPDEAYEVCRALFFLQGMLYAPDMMTCDACEVGYDSRDKEAIASAMEKYKETVWNELQEIVDNLTVKAV